MRILLLGANGQLGRDLQTVYRENHPGFELVSWTRSNLDVSNREEMVLRLEREPFDLLINCTSYHKTDDVEIHATEAFRINAHAVQDMAEICQRKGARLVHISTDYVFRGDRNRPYVETDSPAPLNVYGASKFMGETLAFQCHADTLVLRVASLFGVAGASGKGGNFVETIIRTGREKGLVRVIQNITMSPTSTRDVARSIFVLIEKNGPAGVYHAVNSGEATWFEFAKEILSLAKVNAEALPLSEYPAQAKRPVYSVLDNSKLAQIVGPIPHWKEALKEYLKEKGYR